MTNKAEAVYINRAADCIINRFMAVMFDKKFTALIIAGEPTEEQLYEGFDKILTEYLDLTGQKNSQHFEAVKKVEKLKLRVTLVSTYLDLQDASIAMFNEPHIKGLKALKKQGHTIKWNEQNPDIKDFKEQLKKTRTRGISTEVALIEAQHDLDKIEKEMSGTAVKVAKSTTARANFIDLITRLPTAGFYINRDRTTMEELGSMVRQYNESNVDTVQANIQRRGAYT